MECHLGAGGAPRLGPDDRHGNHKYAAKEQDVSSGPASASIFDLPLVFTHCDSSLSGLSSVYSDRPAQTNISFDIAPKSIVQYIPDSDDHLGSRATRAVYYLGIRKFLPSATHLPLAGRSPLPGTTFQARLTRLPLLRTALQDDILAMVWSMHITMI